MALSLAVGLGPSTGRLGVLTAWGLGAKCKSPNRPNLQDLFMAWPWKPVSRLPHVLVQAATNKPVPRLQGRERSPQHSMGGCQTLQTYNCKTSPAIKRRHSALGTERIRPHKSHTRFRKRQPQAVPSSSWSSRKFTYLLF